MNVRVEHNNVDITQYVISYEREHRICTGIGVLDIEVERGCPREFKTWDSIKIYENGDFKVKYYISEVVDNIPTATKSLKCQDNSKRIVDYFIPDSYIVDYPSYTRYWIEKFLDEAGVSYTFTTSSNGTLLSNMTSLGLMTVYEQLIQLVQQSGWYFYFDGNDRLIIGKFNQTLSPVTDKINETDILSINLVRHDKMLRNRAVVIGAYDPIFSGYASADVSVRTKWNYDSTDKRAVVISNSNIPNKSSAIGMANLLLSEFARINEEKTIELVGARDYRLGDVLSVNSRAYTGKGIITTFGVSMSRNGLITKVILDERCPRLFGFFNLGDYVYVSTFGSGIWRKHIQYDHTWHDFSAGLDQLAITDLHIANGIFSSVGTSGEMYYNLNDDTSWSRLPVSSLMSVPMSGLIYSGVPSGDYSEYFTQAYSGIMGRATIIDRENARILYAVDTFSGINYGDYLMTLSAVLWSHSSGNYADYLYSGMVWSGGLNGWRGWVLEYNPVLNKITDYPINVSGNFNIRVFDIETDGVNDYVSVKLRGGPSDYGRTHYWKSTNATGNNLQEREHYTPLVLGDGVASYPNEEVTEISDSFSEEIFPFYVESNLVENREVNEKVQGNFKHDIAFSVKKYGSDLKPRVRLVGYMDHWWEGFDENFEFLDIIFQNPIPSFSSKYIVRRSGLIFDGYLATLNESAGYVSFTKETVDFQNEYFYPTTEIYRDDVGTSPTHTYLGEVFVNNSLYLLIGRNWYSSIGLNGYPTHLDMNTAEQAVTDIILYQLDTRNGSVSKKVLFTWYTPPIGDGNYWNNLLTIYKPGPPGQFSGPPGVLTIFAKDDRCYIAGLLGYWRNTGSINYLTAYKEANIYRIYGPVDGFNSSFVINTISSQLIDQFSTPYYQYSPLSSPYLNTFGVINGMSRELIRVDHNSNNDLHTVLLDNGVISLDESVYKKTNILASNVQYGIDGFSGNFTRYHYKTGIVNNITPPPGFANVKGYFIDPVGEDSTIIYTVCSKVINDSELGNFLVPYDIENNQWYEEFAIDSDLPSLQTGGKFSRLLGNWAIYESTGYPLKRSYNYIKFPQYFNLDGDYLLLSKKRDNLEFSVIHNGNFPIRTEISQFSPILDVTDEKSKFKSILVMDSSIEIISPIPSGSDIFSGVFVNDYRYTLLPDQSGYLSKQAIYLADYPFMSREYAKMFSGYVLSGIDETNQIRTFDVYSYSGVNNLLNFGYSGILNRIETTNYAGNGQYIFVTTSGDEPRFYQKDPTDTAFVYYSGLPAARATMIRVDDRL